MKALVFIGLLCLMACGGTLSDEQRKKLHEGVDKQKIVKLSDSEITTASLDRGREVFALLEQLKFDLSKVDSVARKYDVKIRWITPGSANALEVETQLIEAYVIGAETGSTQDNIQAIHSGGKQDYDSLLYSKPILTPMADGVVNVDGVWNIYMAKKDIILSAAKNY